MAVAEKEAARKVTRKRKAKGKDSYCRSVVVVAMTSGGVHLVTRCQQPILALVNCRSCDLVHYGHVGALEDLVTLWLTAPSLLSGIFAKVVM